MNNTSPATPATETSCLLSEDDYNQYRAVWKEIAGPSGTNLTQAFLEPGLEPDRKRLTALSFPLERIKWLVSAVGVSQIKARFLLMPGTEGQQFNLVLFATDAKDNRLSAYYLPDPYFATITPMDGVGEQIPLDLASDWQNYWQAEGEIHSDMFRSHDAKSHEPVTLEGYNFKVKDFVSALFDDQPGLGANMSMALGLHKYHAPTATSEEDLTKTFGLILQATTEQTARIAGAARVDFDMAFPCPPGT